VRAAREPPGGPFFLGRTRPTCYPAGVPHTVANPHEQMDRFRQYLVEQGLKFTTQRRAIAEAFFDGGKHLSLTDLLEMARAKHASVGFATVYRTMKLMSESGLASEHKFAEGQEARYEPAFEGEHHDHLICVRCGRIVEFEDDGIEARQHEIAASHGFRVTSHRHEIYGMCGDCE
jgi:Fur family ferric uptake transcriptional regulator